MLEIGISPDEWKKAKVHPIFKSGERNIPSKYRPISILPDHIENYRKGHAHSAVRVLSSR